MLHQSMPHTPGCLEHGGNECQTHCFVLSYLYILMIKVMEISHSKKLTIMANKIG